MVMLGYGEGSEIPNLRKPFWTVLLKMVMLNSAGCTAWVQISYVHNLWILEDLSEPFSFDGGMIAHKLISPAVWISIQEIISWSGLHSCQLQHAKTVLARLRYLFKELLLWNFLNFWCILD